MSSAKQQKILSVISILCECMCGSSECEKNTAHTTRLEKGGIATPEGREGAFGDVSPPCLGRGVVGKTRGAGLSLMPFGEGHLSRRFPGRSVARAFEPLVVFGEGRWSSF